MKKYLFAFTTIISLLFLSCNFNTNNDSNFASVNINFIQHHELPATSSRTIDPGYPENLNNLKRLCKR